MRKDTFDKTRVNVKGTEYSKETIRKYEDPEFTRAADEYERRAREKMYGVYDDDLKSRAEKFGEDARDFVGDKSSKLRYRAKHAQGTRAAGNVQDKETGFRSGKSSTAGSFKSAMKDAKRKSRRASAGRFADDAYRAGNSGNARDIWNDNNGYYDNSYDHRYEDYYDYRQDGYQADPYQSYEDPAYEEASYGGRNGGGNGGGGQRRGAKTGRKKKKRRLKKHIVLRNILVLLLIALVAFSGFFMAWTGKMDHVSTRGADFAISDTAKKDCRGYRNIAILGLDARADESYDGSRTDAIIILSIKKSTGKVKMISVMRDSYLKMEDTEGNLIFDKITHAHHYGGGIDTIAALNRNLDLNIKEFMIFNWSAVSDTVDALGGIEVDVKANEIRDLNKWGPETAENCGGTWTPITKTGKQTIDGVQATTYCRIRKTSGGDTGRGNRYKKVVTATIKKAMTHPGKMMALREKVLPKIRTNMNGFNFLTLGIRAPFYDINKSLSWPKDYYGGLLQNGVWYAVPRTLDSNVTRLHKQAFDSKDYTPSDTVQSLSNEIITYTGIQ